MGIIVRVVCLRDYIPQKFSSKKFYKRQAFSFSIKIAILFFLEKNSKNHQFAFFHFPSFFKFLTHFFQYHIKRTLRRINNLGDADDQKLPLNKQWIIKVFSILISICLTAINSILSNNLVALTNAEKHVSKTSFHTSYRQKIKYSSFITCCFLLTVYHFLFVTPNWYFWSSHGIIVDGWSIVVNLAFISPLMCLLSPGWIIKKIQQWWVKRGINDTSLTQIELNQMFWGDLFEPAVHYADIGNAFFSCMYFAAVQPVSSVIAFFGMVFLYWIQKYLTLRRYSRKSYLGSKIAFGTFAGMKVGMTIFAVIDLPSILLPSVISIYHFRKLIIFYSFKIIKFLVKMKNLNNSKLLLFFLRSRN